MQQAQVMGGIVIFSRFTIRALAYQAKTFFIGTCTTAFFLQ
jgi:hypothetical protein